ncbi:MAG: molybdopterin-dependent oxidoreductase, partial [Methyloprofundus sp.]|nr:molybdopterin-dependent oxidoreductase [Methyloprofundus sp.]
ALSAQAHYATPHLNFDTNTETGEPFAYHVYGCAAVEVTVDCLRGRYQVNKLQIIHDVGQSLAPAIDRGQIEGAAVQGVGWLTSEEIRYDSEGRLQTDNLTSYKIPDIYAAPDMQINFLNSSGNSQGIFNSKAVGEPPFMYGIGAYFALVKAIQSFNPAYQPDFIAPMTPEKVLLVLHGKVLWQE